MHDTDVYDKSGKSLSTKIVHDEIERQVAVNDETVQKKTGVYDETLIKRGCL